MADLYTHKFKIRAGGQKIEGEIEFDTDGKVSYKTDEPLDGLQLEESVRLNALFNEFKQIFYSFGSIEKIELKEN